MDPALHNNLNAIPPGADASAPLPDETELRARTYQLLGTLLSAPPDRELLARLAALDVARDAHGDERPLAAAWDALRLAARNTSPTEADDEYHALFIGIGRGELLPYGSWYMTGFLMEQPLVVLRRDLAALGIERLPDVSEPEDHAGALCETMGCLITADDISFTEQCRFFTDHLAPWFTPFFQDLQQAAAARFYRAVGRLGGAFTEFETKYLSMLA